MSQRFQNTSGLVPKGATLVWREQQHSQIAAHVTADQHGLIVVVLVEVVVHRANLRNDEVIIVVEGWRIEKDINRTKKQKNEFDLDYTGKVNTEGIIKFICVSASMLYCQKIGIYDN